jgi:hypothetical protein
MLSPEADEAGINRALASSRVDRRYEFLEAGVHRFRLLQNEREMTIADGKCRPASSAGRAAIAYWKIAAARPTRSAPDFEWISNGLGASLDTEIRSRS